MPLDLESHKKRLAEIDDNISKVRISLDNAKNEVTRLENLLNILSGAYQERNMFINELEAEEVSKKQSATPQGQSANGTESNSPK